MFPLDLSLWKSALGILGTIAVVWIGVLVIRRARRNILESRPPRPEALLAPFETAFRRGEMSEAEFQRIRDSLDGHRTSGTPLPGTPANSPPETSNSGREVTSPSPDTQAKPSESGDPAGP